jgi:hypothetical protein
MKRFCVIHFTAFLAPSNPKYGEIDNQVKGYAGIAGDDEKTVRAVFAQILADNHFILDKDEGGTVFELPTGPTGDPTQDALLEKLRTYGYFMYLGALPLKHGKN